MVKLHYSAADIQIALWDEAALRVVKEIELNKDSSNMDDLFLRSYFIKQMQLIDEAFAKALRIPFSDIDKYKLSTYKLFPEEFLSLIGQEIDKLASHYYIKIDEDSGFPGKSNINTVLPSQKVSQVWNDGTFKKCLKILQQGVIFDKIIDRKGNYI